MSADYFSKDFMMYIKNINTKPKQKIDSVCPEVDYNLKNCINLICILIS